MATTKRKTTTSKKTATKKPTVRKQSQNIAARTSRTISNQPYVSAAIATGAVAAVAAAAAGAYFFRRQEKTMGELADQWGARMKDGFNEAVDFATETGKAARSKASMFFSKMEDELEQSDLAEEAMTLKTIGRKSRRPVDPTVETELKTGAISY